MTNANPVLSDETRQRIDDLARQQKREPSEVLEEAVRRYAASCRLERFAQRMEKSARNRNIREEDVPSVVEEVRRETQLRDR
jgi:predicted transcriptional regulator